MSRNEGGPEVFSVRIPLACLDSRGGASLQPSL